MGRDDDISRTIAHPARRELVVRASRFIADALPAANADVAATNLQKIRAEWHAATHHCWAYRVGTETIAARCADDGEPAGTAGRPILAAIERRDLSNVLVVVTRYFGGVKLGPAGLARAYGDAAAAALDAAGSTTVPITRTVHVTCTYEALPRVKAVLYRHALAVEESSASPPVLIARVRRGEVARLESLLREASRGAVTIAIAGA